MPLRQPLPQNSHPLSKDVRKNIAFNAPIPGSSLTKEPKSQPFEKPPQFVKLPDAMNHMMDQLLEPFYYTQLIQLMDAGITVEAIARTLLFTGFTLGKWTVDLGMLMYKPLMLALMAIAHRAGLKDTPVLLPRAVAQHHLNKFKTFQTATQLKDMRSKATQPFPKTETELPGIEAAASNGGFMRRIKG